MAPTPDLIRKWNGLNHGDELIRAKFDEVEEILLSVLKKSQPELVRKHKVTVSGYVVDKYGPEYTVHPIIMSNDPPGNAPSYLAMGGNNLADVFPCRIVDQDTIEVNWANNYGEKEYSKLSTEKLKVAARNAASGYFKVQNFDLDVESVPIFMAWFYERLSNAAGIKQTDTGLQVRSKD